MERMNYDGRYQVETPEQIEIDYEVAGIGTRFLAASIDTILLLIIQLIVGVGFFWLSETISFSDATGSILIAFWAIVSFIFFWGYYTVFELLWAGQSPGKRLFGLRVVREGGRPVTVGAVVTRNLLRIVDFLPSFYGIGVLVMFIDKRSRRLGDLAAGSLVIKVRNEVSLEALVREQSNLPPVAVAPRPIDAPEQPLIAGIEQLSNEDYDLVQEFLRRRATLEPQARARLAEQLANALRNRLGLPLSGHPEAFIEHVVREYRVAVALRQQGR